MTNTEIEKRLSVLENEFALLKSKIKTAGESKKAWWAEIAGTFADDPAHEEAMRLGREYRVAQKMNYDDEDNE